MEIRYKNSDDEIMEYYLFKKLNGREFKEEVRRSKMMYYLMGGLVAVYAVYLLIKSATTAAETEKTGLFFNAISMATVALLTTLFSFIVPKMLRFFSKSEIKRQLKKNPAESPKTVIKIDSKNFAWQQGNEKGSVRLTSEILVVEKGNNYFIDTKKAFFVIPKRVFEKDGELSEFEKLMNLEDRINKTSALINAKGK